MVFDCRYLIKKKPQVVFYKKGALKNLQNSQENTCARASFLIKLQPAIKKETLVQVFSCDTCKRLLLLIKFNFT